MAMGAASMGGLADSPSGMSIVGRESGDEQANAIAANRMTGNIEAAPKLTVPAKQILQDDNKMRVLAIHEWRDEWKVETMEPVKGVEPLTCGLRNRCSATELHRLEREQQRQI